jgi:hypothetical protein
MTYYSNSDTEIGVALSGGFRMPIESDTLTPDVNGATADPNGDLDSALVWNPDGSIDVTMSPSTAETNPNQGWQVVLPFRDDIGQVATLAPEAFGLNLFFDTVPAGSSGLVCWIGVAVDTALAGVVWVSLDWTSADPRARAAVNGNANVSGTRTGLTTVKGSANFIQGATLASPTRIRSLEGSMPNLDGTYNTSITKTCNLNVAGQVYLCFGAFSLTGATGPYSFTYTPSAYIRQLAAGERF